MVRSIFFFFFKKLFLLLIFKVVNSHFGQFDHANWNWERSKQANSFKVGNVSGFQIRWEILWTYSLYRRPGWPCFLHQGQTEFQPLRKQYQWHLMDTKTDFRTFWFAIVCLLLVILKYFWELNKCQWVNAQKGSYTICCIKDAVASSIQFVRWNTSDGYWPVK